MNKLLKTIILIAYTFVIFLGAILIIYLSTNSKQFAEYTTNPYNDDLNLNVQMMEVRMSENDESNKTDYEYSKYDLKLFVRRTTDQYISNIYTYVCVESQDGKKYTETSSPKQMGQGTWQTTTMYLLNSSYEFAYNKIIKDAENTDKLKQENFIPKKVYLKVVYEVDLKEPVDNKDTETRELNYMFKVEELNRTAYSSYEKRDVISGSVNTGYIDFKEDLVKIKLTHDLVEADNKDEVNKDKFSFSRLEANSATLADGVKIDRINLVVEAEITNTDLVNDKYFSKYIRLFTYNGALVRSIPISSIRDVSIDEAYNCEKLYFTIVIDLSTGDQIKTNFYVLVNEL